MVSQFKFKNNFDSYRLWRLKARAINLMSIDEFLGSDKVVPQLQERLKDYLKVSD